MKTLEERLFAKTNILGNCWIWEGAMHGMGYGQINVTSGYRQYKMVDVHRVSYELFVGPIPEGLEIDHLCRVPACLNPEHLEAVTRQENNLRSNCLGTLNAQKTHCLRGHPFDEANTYAYLKKDGKTARACKTCQAMRSKGEI